MILTRRRLLAGLALGGAAAATGVALARERPSRPGWRDIRVRASAFEAFDLHDVSRRRFGELDFVGGLELSADDPGFCGFSSLRLLDRNDSFLALSDRATFFTGRLESRDGRPVAIGAARLAPALDGRGRPLVATRRYDTESMAFHKGALYAGVERSNDILRFDWTHGGPMAGGVPIAVPARVKHLPHNRGLEALGSMPPGSASPGSLIAISERAGDIDAPTIGFLIGGQHPGQFAIRRHDRFDITDLDFLPSGDLVLLERFFTWTSGVKMRLRRVPLATVRAGAMLDGEILLTADMGYNIDNMEGLSISRSADGRTLLTLISDDNFSALQRTLMLRFALNAG